MSAILMPFYEFFTKYVCFNGEQKYPKSVREKLHEHYIKIHQHEASIKQHKKAIEKIKEDYYKSKENNG